MITHLALLKKKAEYEQLLKVIQKYAAIYTDEMWSYLYAQSVSGAEALLAAEPVLDFISWDVTVKDALTALEKMRSFHRDAFNGGCRYFRIAHGLFKAGDFSGGAPDEAGEPPGLRAGDEGFI